MQVLVCLRETLLHPFGLTNPNLHLEWEGTFMLGETNRLPLNTLCPMDSNRMFLLLHLWEVFIKVPLTLLVTRGWGDPMVQIVSPYCLG